MNKKLYTHTTSGGAEYLMDTFIPWKHNGKSGKEGTINENTRLLIRMDGKQPELIYNSAEEERDEILQLLEVLLDTLSRNGGSDNVDVIAAKQNAREAIAKMRG